MTNIDVVASRNWSESARDWQSSRETGRNGPDLAKLARNWANSTQKLASFARSSSNSADNCQVRLKLAQNWSSSPEVGRTRPRSGRVRAKMTEVAPELVNLARNWRPEVGRNGFRIGQTTVDATSSFCQCRVASITPMRRSRAAAAAAHLAKKSLGSTVEEGAGAGLHQGEVRTAEHRLGLLQAVEFIRTRCLPDLVVLQEPCDAPELAQPWTSHKLESIRTKTVSAWADRLSVARVQCPAEGLRQEYHRVSWPLRGRFG